MTSPARALTAPSLPTGFVEVVAGDRVLGWAWDPAHPKSRLRVELRLGDAVLTDGIADRPRDDLAAGGIGDGRHAFELAVEPAHRDRGAGFVVVAHGEEGSAVLVSAAGTPAANAAEGVSRVERGLNSLVGSQRLIHRNLQAVLMAVRGGGALDAAAAEAREELRQQVAVLEIFVTRLDERLARLADVPQADTQAGGHALLIAGLGVMAGAGLATAAMLLLA